MNTADPKKKTSLVALRRKARHYAVQALYQWKMAGANINQIEAEFRADYDFEKVDSEYFHELVHQIPAKLEEIDALITPYLDRDVSDLGAVEISVLRLATYELKYRIDVPYKVSINEAVSLTKKFGATDSHKYINGVIDQVAQELRALEVTAEKK